ncbi:tyrosine-type recombinase/integrase [Fusobacterium mortiferum]|uniref:Site-specific integrase n=1 Tax=Fusobacterium mortiferum TaxID=850 RepID=A0ABS2G2E8_FUSMR|nr:site-specific integrase [Fusobacterium mortiferum]MBM6874930.1 site-specific integrase [Fusobacterium mortiferum]
MDFINEFLIDSKANGRINSSTLEIYRKDIEDFDGFIIGKDLIDVEAQDLVNYIEELKKKYSDMSIYRKMSSLKSFYKYLLKSKIIDVNPTKDIELPSRVKKVTEPLEKWELKRILDVCDETYEGKRDSLVIKLLYETGFKIGDILNLEKDELSRYEYKIINIRSASKILNQKISENLSKELKFFSERLLPNMYTNRNKLFQELTREGFRVRFIGYGKKAELERDISPNMIKKIVTEEKIRDEDGVSLIDKIREQYMRIGIGDD